MRKRINYMKKRKKSTLRMKRKMKMESRLGRKSWRIGSTILAKELTICTIKLVVSSLTDMMFE